MNKYLDFPEEELKVRTMAGDPKALAWSWILGYLAILNNQIQTDSEYGEDISIEELLDTATSVINGDWGSIVRGGTFEGYHIDPVFWEKFSVLIGKDIPQCDRTNFLSCSC